MTIRSAPVWTAGEGWAFSRLLPRNLNGWMALMVRLSASFLLGLGGVVMLGWWLQQPAIVQINPGFTPMQFNTALCFSLSGAGLWGVALRRKWLAIGLGAAVCGLAGVTLLQYPTGWSFGVDELFMTHFTSVETSHPGRMAPNTAVAFLLSGTFLIGAMAPAQGSWAHSALLVLSPAILGMSLLSLAGYATGLEVLFGWSEYTRMAVHTSVGFLVFGAGAVCKAWRLEAERGYSRSFSVIAPSVVASLTLLAGLWMALSHYEAERVALLIPINPEVARTALPEVVLITGLLVTVLIGVAVHYVHEARETERLRAANDELRAAIAELDTFAHVASHDLKAPLRGIRQLATWLRKDLDDAEDERVSRYLGQIDTRVARMQDLLDALLSYSRVGRSRRQTASITLAEALAGVVAMADLPQTFQVSVEAGNAVLEVDPALFDAVMLNLLTNAVKHHDRPGGEIRIRVLESEAAITVSLADDGPGIEPRFHQKIFEIFQTLKPRDELEASGMGLAIVRKALHHTGGDIRIESDPSQARGTVFHVSWPKGERHVRQHTLGF